MLREYERAVIFRLGRLIGAKGPGLIILIPLIDRMVKVSLRLVAMDVPPQDVITRDNVSVKVNAVVYFRVMDANQGHRGGGKLPVRHLPAGPDHPAEHLRRSRT